MPWGTYTVEVKWDGVSWTDESRHVKQIGIRRGYDDAQETMQEGVANLSLWDTTGRYNPRNASSPLYPYTARPLRQVRIRCLYSAVTYDLFTGYTRTVYSNPARGVVEAQISCVDAFAILGAVKPVIAPFVGSTVDALASIFLDAGILSSFAYISLGDAINFPGADGSATGLALIAEALTAERGWVYVRANGTSMYLYRHWQNHSWGTTVAATISNTMQNLASGVDLASIRNRAMVTATGGATQTYEDAASVAEYYARDYSPITTDYLSTDAQALSLATYLVRQRADGILPVRSLDLNNGKAVPYAALLGVDLSNRVTVADSLGGTSGSYHVMTIEHTIRASARHHLTTWGLAERESIQPFLIGVSNIGSTTDLITY